jgi:hypothetical protein
MYTRPDGRITGWHILGSLSIAGGVVIAVGGTILSDGAVAGPSLQAGAKLIASGLVLIGMGKEIEKAQKSTGQNLTNRTQAAAPSPVPQLPDQDDNNPRFKDDKETAKDFGYKNTSDFESGAKNDILTDARGEARSTGNKGLQRF